MNPARPIRIFLLLETLSFLGAALIHFGILTTGFEHAKAGTAESVIGAVLACGFLIGLLRPPWIRTVGMAAQGFALLGTMVGLFTIAIGVGPRTAPDLVFHSMIVVVLAWGLVKAIRAANHDIS